MKAILKMPADLLWFGGIGTYIRASTESDDRVGDRANDADPHHRRGAALQGDRRGRQSRHDPARPHRGRACAACKLNTDAIDNSAGVNTSDLEVNIKIALARRCATGGLPPRRATRCWREMTDEVAALVLRNNYLQTLALSLAERRGLEDSASSSG